MREVEPNKSLVILQDAIQQLQTGLSVVAKRSSSGARNSLVKLRKVLRPLQELVLSPGDTDQKSNAVVIYNSLNDAIKIIITKSRSETIAAAERADLSGIVTKALKCRVEFNTCFPATVVQGPLRDVFRSHSDIGLLGIF